MKCDKCQKQEASVHVTHKMECGKYVTVNLCTECAKTVAQPYMDKGPSLVDMFGQMVNALKSIQENETLRIECPKCGWTWKKFMETGKFGCPNDYEVFKMAIANVLKQLHGNIGHTGKMPPNRKSHYSEEQIKILEEKMAEAVKKEHYELAAKLRDQIKILKDKMADVIKK
jgi:protein arginine kinase activator